MKKLFSLILAAVMLLSCTLCYAEEMPPEKPDGEMAQGTPPEMPSGGIPENMESLPNKPDEKDGEMAQGTPSEMPSGGMPENMENPPEKPDGEAPNGMSGGMQGAPTEYASVYTVTEDTDFSDELTSTGKDENLIHVVSGTAYIRDANITRVSDDSTGGDSSSFYGVGAAILANGGIAVIESSSIATNAAGSAGVFAYGDGVVYVSDTTIITEQNTAGGIHVAGGGALYAKNLNVTTEGESSAAIRSDRGGGTMVIDGGVYTANGVGSPAVYVTADISIHDADLNAAGSEALCMEGLNTVRLFDCNLSGAMQDLDQNDNTWTVIVYQSMSGDSEIGKGCFEMIGGTLESANGGLFYTTNTESEFVLNNVNIAACEDSEYFLRVTGNANKRGWGDAGRNGADCVFTGIAQLMEGEVQWDSISTLDMYVAEGSQLVGAVINDESCAGNGGDGHCNLYIDAASSWIVTGDSRLTNLKNEGMITDADDRSVTIVTTDGNILVQGESAYTITVDTYSTICDMTSAGNTSEWEDHAVEF